MKRVCSIFSQILQLIPRDKFEAAVKQHQAERHARGFSSWGQFVAMMFCQLAQAKSLREITEGLQASEGKLRHLGLPEAPARSTLAYANSHRPWQLFETVFVQLLADCQKRLGVAKVGSKLGWPGKLVSLDATVIDLCAAVFDWAQFRTTKGAVGALQQTFQYRQFPLAAAEITMCKLLQAFGDRNRQRGYRRSHRGSPPFELAQKILL
ncbi:MAG TPA: DUF4372 domain-containing protein [Edaphobacter sp.]|nr:DUF4372 domain-containing protein [Edaphobacter sp.]